MADDLDVVILRTPVMSVWCPDRLRRPAIEWMQEPFSLRVNEPGREADLSPLSTSNFNGYLELYFPFPYIFMSG